MAFSSHITERSFWYKQPSLPPHVTMEAYKARFRNLLQYDMWMTSNIRYSVFFGKPPQKTSEVRYPVFFITLSRQKLRAQAIQSSSARYSQMASNTSYPIFVSTALPTVIKMLHSDLAVYGSASQGSDPQQFCQKQESVRTQVSASGINCSATHPSIYIVGMLPRSFKSLER